MARHLLTWIALVCLLSGCIPFDLAPGAVQFGAEMAPAWVYTELRCIDPPDAPTAALDLVAAYLRRLRQPRQSLRILPSYEWQIRLELLDVSPAGGTDLYLALDHTLGGSRELPGGIQVDLEWDTLVHLPARGPAQAWNAQQEPLDGLPLSIQRDTLLDTIEIRLPASALLPSRAGLRLQAITTASGSAVEADRIAPIFSEGPPPAPLQVWMAFWNTLPAYTPAQALRRWDGAHTGPYGGRHGLYNLLRTARARRIPLALLDLKALPSLAALDYTGGLPLVQRMAGEGLLLLPEVQPLPEGQNLAPGAAGVAALGRQTGLDFGLPASPAVFLPELDSSLGPRQLAAIPVLQKYDLVIAAATTVADPAPSSPPSLAVYTAGSQRILHLGTPLEGPQATPSGPSQQVIRHLAAAAAQPGPPGQAVIALGGDLTQSGWGDPASARQSFDYLASRPWVRFVFPGDLASITPATLPAAPSPAGRAQDSVPLPAQSDAPLQTALAQFFASLYGPVSPAAPDLAKLRSAYAGQAGALQLAAAWADQPFPILSCDQDVNEDGQAECILASTDTLAILDAASGGLAYLYVLDNGNLHLLIAPSALFAVGLGDPAGWDPAAGMQADPQVIPGAFWVGQATPGCPCQAEASGDGLLLRGVDLERLYRLLPGGGVRVEIRADAPILWELPLAVDPWERFTPGWGKRYAGSWEGQDWVWGLENGVRLRVRSSQPLQVASFTDSQARIGLTEDPNAENPPGHYLPFPLSLVHLQGQGEHWVEIRLALR